MRAIVKASRSRGTFTRKTLSLHTLTKSTRSALCCRYTHTHTRTHTHTHTHAHARTHKHKHKRKRKHAYTHAYFLLFYSLSFPLAFARSLSHLKTFHRFLWHIVATHTHTFCFYRSLHQSLSDFVPFLLSVSTHTTHTCKHTHTPFLVISLPLFLSIFLSLPRLRGCVLSLSLALACSLPLPPSLFLELEREGEEPPSLSRGRRRGRWRGRDGEK